MEVGNTVYIMAPDGHWKGKITDISEVYKNKTFYHHYSFPLATIKGDHGEFAVVFEKQLELKDGEYWQFKH